MRNLKLGNRMNVAAIAVVIALAALPFGALAQSPTLAGNKRVTLNVENGDLRYALKLLFTSAGMNYTLDQAVSGSVTVSLSDVPFRTALESLLRSTHSVNPLTYRVEDGVYSIFPKKEVPDKPEIVIEGPTADAPKSRIVKITLNFADAEDITKAFGGTVLRSRFGGNMGAILDGNKGVSNFGSGQNGNNGFHNGSGLGNGTSGFSNFGTGLGSGNGIGFGNGNTGRNNGGQGRGR
jgi:type II secretory pathway component HofQ